MKQNGLRKEEDIMMKLLDASSDSDPEPLNLPPLKGKKLVKRKKSSYNVPNTSVCDPCSFIKVLAVILMISLLVLLGVLTVMLYNQIDGLKKTLKSEYRGRIMKYEQRYQNEKKMDFVHCIRTLETDKKI